MANTALTEYLQFHGQQGATGCICTYGESEDGFVYLQHGKVVHAENPHYSGLCAFFSILGKQDLRIEWRDASPSPQISFNEGVDTLLFQYAQLEDSGQTDEKSLQTLFGGVEKQGNCIRLTEIGSYRITFEVTNAELNGIVFHLEKPVTLIGRKPDCDVIIPDGTVSSYHCNIILETNCVRVVDLGSTNGTRVNGQLVTDSIVQVNDELWVGNVAMRMSMHMQRRLALRSDAPKEIAPAKENTAKSTTVKIDTSGIKVQKKAPIRWDNVDNGTDASKRSSGSLLSKFFKK